MNWQNIIKQIQSCGLSQTLIGERIGRSQAWVSALSQGKYSDVSWTDGQAIIALAQQVCTDAAVHATESTKINAQEVA